MMDRILYHIYCNDMFSDNQYGLTPQGGTVDAAMEVNPYPANVKNLVSS
jgi:hypothetical protein